MKGSGTFGWRDHFPISRECTYLDHAFVGPLSQDARDAIDVALDEHARRGSTAFEPLMQRTEEARRRIANFIGAAADEVAMVNTTSMALSLVAAGLDWRFGDSVVIPEIEYLSNVYPWLHLADRGVEVRMVPATDGRVCVDDLIAACDSRTRVVAVSWVEFSNGYRVDVDTLGQACRERGILFVVDANHAVGMFPVDVRVRPIDVLATQSFKWLLGPFNVGWLFIRRDIIERFRPAVVGPLSAESAPSFLHQGFTLRSDAARFETGVPNFAGAIGAAASVELLERVGIQAIENRILDLTDQLAEGLLRRGYVVLSARDDPGQKSGILIFRHPRPETVELSEINDIAKTLDGARRRSRGLDRTGVDVWHAACVRCLERNGVVVSMREGAVRVSPHFYNTENEINKLVDSLP